MERRPCAATWCANAKPPQRLDSTGRRANETVGLGVTADVSDRNEGQMVMNRPDRGRTLADGGGDSLRRSGPDITHRQEPWTAGFERQRCPPEPFPAVVELVICQRPVGEDEAAIVKCSAAREPS